MKKVLAATLCAALLCVGGMPLLAEENTTNALISAPAEAGTGETAADLPLAQSPYILGKQVIVQSIESLENGGSRLLVKTDGEDAQEILLNTDEKTVVMDTQTGLAAQLSGIKAGDTIYVYHSPAMTRSLPPQTYAMAILVNLPENASPAHLLVAEEVKRNDDGSVTVTCDNGGMLVTLPADMPISPLYTKNVVTNQDVILGTPFFAWYDIVALSYPGQTTALRAVVLPTADLESVAVYVNGAALEAEGKVENGVVMAPVRAVAEAMGLKVTWNGEDRTVTVASEETAALLKLDEAACVMLDGQGLATGPDVVLTAPVELGEDGLTWAPAEIFGLIRGQLTMSYHSGALFF